MACFLVPMTEAIVVTVADKVAEHHLKKTDPAKLEKPENGGKRLSFHHKVKWLKGLLWGGSALLAFEHLWHGEIAPYFPFLTAANSPEDFQAMLGEMATVGVTMALLVTAVWGLMLLGSYFIERRAEKEELAAGEGAS